MSRPKIATLAALVVFVAGCQRGCGDEPVPPAAEAPAADAPGQAAATGPSAPTPGSVPLQVLESAAKQMPDDPTARQQLALGLVKAQRAGDAVAEFEKVAELRPGVGTLMDLGVAYAMAQRFDDAQRTFERVLTLEPGNAEALHSLGNVAATRGDAKRAMELFRKALESNPDHLAARFNVARLLQAAGDERGAYTEYARVADQEPTNPDELALGDQAVFQMALLDIKNGAHARAEEELRVLIETNPKHPIAHQVLGELLLRMGRTEEAQAELELQKRMGPGASAPPQPAG